MFFLGVTKEDKFKLEESGLDKMLSELGNDPIANEIKDLWMEYETNKTKAAKLVKDYDKLEMLIQAFEYEVSGLFWCVIFFFGCVQWDNKLRRRLTVTGSRAATLL